MMNINPNPQYSSLPVSQQPGAGLSADSRLRPPDSQLQPDDNISLHQKPSPPLTYSKNLQVNTGSNAQLSMLRDLVANLLREQGVNTTIATGSGEISLEALTVEEAQELVSEDGYFGVEQTSERIFQFAIGLAGGNPSHIDAVKKGIDQGFAEAKKAFGGWLPDISYTTYDAVMQKLDTWVTEARAAV
ncbi:MAG: hypothetical protein RBQ88_00360 [Desulfobulbus oligotrophicus]|jgi:hypothetical protein|nr:hypothetical protein [Desulfobulbus oligotrophicus]